MGQARFSPLPTSFPSEFKFTVLIFEDAKTCADRFIAMFRACHTSMEDLLGGIYWEGHKDEDVVHCLFVVRQMLLAEVGLIIWKNQLYTRGLENVLIECIL